MNASKTSQTKAPKEHATQRFVDLMSLSTRQAGVVAAHLQGKVQVETKAHEATPEGQAVTAVDLATQDLILHQLQRYWPEVAVDAEEDTKLARCFSQSHRDQPLVVLDPIDGTFNYSRGSREYAVMAGLIQGGHFRAAVIHYPTLNATYWAVEGKGCFLEKDAGPPLRVGVAPVHPVSEKLSRLLVSPRVPEFQRNALRSVAETVTTSRCSAFDGACLALDIAPASIAESRADRRRAIALYLNLAAGAEVQMGRRKWAGEDPITWESEHEPTICAPDAAWASHLLRVYTGDSSD